MLGESNPYAAHLKNKQTNPTELVSFLHLYRLARHCKDPIEYHSSEAAWHLSASYSQSNLYGFK